MAVDPAPRGNVCPADWLEQRRPVALGCDGLLLRLLDWLRLRECELERLLASLFEVVVGVLDVLDAEAIKVHDVHGCAAVACEDLCALVYVEVRVGADRDVRRAWDVVRGHASLAERADDCCLRVTADGLPDAERVLWPLAHDDCAAVVFVADPHYVASENAARVFADAVVLALLALGREEHGLHALDRALLVERGKDNRRPVVYVGAKARHVDRCARSEAP